ncbi:MAG: type II toxin-antitoxin system HipA family toxin [Cyanobacteria bacterium TGS_CYA1]|nr:type II toxin-antitoxin system HipA family toxin [Cyanobacteria bacterium TGS_CYA1]
MKKSLNVYLSGKLTGFLSLTGAMSFKYAESAKRRLSLSMPVREESYKNKNCEAYFGGLLPEGTNTRKVIANAVGANSNSSFSLLEKIGNDCAGAVIITPDTESSDLSTIFSLTGEEIADETLYRMITELPRKPLFIGEELRISLAGAQSKGALCLIDNKLCMPGLNVPTTHILKPEIDHESTPDSVENEYFCISLARAVGLNTPAVQIRSVHDVKYLLVERFDRIIHSNGQIERLHQEDFCQALGVVSTKKYQTDGGPSLKDCFDLVERTSFPAREKIELLKRVIFNYVVGNADSHAKNFALLHLDENYVELAPAYDILSTAIYPKLTRNLAMAIGGESELDSIGARNWERFSKLIEIKPGDFKRIAVELTKQITKQLPALKANMHETHLWNDSCDLIYSLVNERTENLNLSLTNFKT